MSENERIATKTDYQQSPNFVVLPADGALIRMSREQIVLTFFVEHFTPEVKNRTTITKSVTRELKYEVRMPASAGKMLAKMIRLVGEKFPNDTAMRSIGPPPIDDTMTVGIVWDKEEDDR
jgi:hypothetical protein